MTLFDLTLDQLADLLLPKLKARLFGQPQSSFNTQEFLRLRNALNDDPRNKQKRRALEEYIAKQRRE